MQLLLKGTGPAWRATEEYRTQLATWLEAFKKEAPTVTPVISKVSEPGKATIPDKKKPDEGMSTESIALFSLLGALAATAIAYIGYRFAKRGSAPALTAPRSPAMSSRGGHP